MRKPKNKAAAAAPPAPSPIEAARATATIWKAMDYHHECVEGFLVTEPGDVNRPLAFVWLHSEVNEWNVYSRACEALRDPSEAWRGQNVVIPGIDLRPFGGSHDAPMPSFIYALRCFPVDDAAAEDAEGVTVPTLDIPAVEPRPFCRFMAESLGGRAVVPQAEPTPADPPPTCCASSPAWQAMKRAAGRSDLLRLLVSLEAEPLCPVYALTLAIRSWLNVAVESRAEQYQLYFEEAEIEQEDKP